MLSYVYAGITHKFFRKIELYRRIIFIYENEHEIIVYCIYVDPIMYAISKRSESASFLMSSIHILLGRPRYLHSFPVDKFLFHRSSHILGTCLV